MKMNSVYDIIKWCVALPIVGLAAIIVNHAAWVRMGPSEALAVYMIEVFVLSVIVAQIYGRKPEKTELRHETPIREQSVTLDPMLVDREWDIDNWRG